MATSTFNPHHHKRRGHGKFLRFNLKDPKVLNVVVIDPGNIVRKATIEDPAEIALFVSKVAKSADGRYVGIFEPERGAEIPETQEVTKVDGKVQRDKDGNAIMTTVPAKRVVIPATVAPQAAILDVNGGSNIAWMMGGGIVHRLLIPFDSLSDTEAIDLVTNRDDVPEYRRKTLDANFQPSK